MFKFIILFFYINIFAEDQILRSIDFYKRNIYLEFINKNYNNVDNFINEALDNYPFHDESKNLRIFQIFNHYINQEYEKMFADVDIFMTLYKYDEDLYYIFYLKLKALEKIIEENGISNSKEKMIDAEELAKTLTLSNSKFTLSSKIILQKINKMIILNELEIADFYYSMSKLNACLSRLNNINENFKIDEEIKLLINTKKNLCKK